MEAHLRAKGYTVLRWGIEHVRLPRIAIDAARRGAPGYEALRHRPDLLAITASKALWVEVKALTRPHATTMTVNAAQLDYQLAAYKPLYLCAVDVQARTFRALPAERLRDHIIDRIPDRPTTATGSGAAHYLVDLAEIREKPLEVDYAKVCDGEARRQRRRALAAAS